MSAMMMIVSCCRPQTHGEEELQLQLALAMSREEAEAEDSKKKSDDMRLQMAIAKSKEEVSKLMYLQSSTVSCFRNLVRTSQEVEEEEAVLSMIWWILTSGQDQQ